MTLIPPSFMDAVVAIGFATKADETPQYVATGFLYGRHVEGTAYSVCLVTNRHVFEGQTKAWLRFNPEGNEPAREYYIGLVDADGGAVWVTDDAAGVDLAVIGINANMLREHGIRLFFFESDHHVLSLAQAREEGLAEGDGVFALGFPMGLVGRERNFVIVRMGAIARISDAYAGASPEILADLPVFPGNSGGPVITKAEATSVGGMKSVGRAALVGVVASYIPFQDIAISTQTNRPRIIFEENSGLTSVVPVDHIIRLADIAFERAEKRDVPPEIDTTTPAASGDGTA